MSAIKVAVNYHLGSNDANKMQTKSDKNNNMTSKCHIIEKRKNTMDHATYPYYGPPLATNPAETLLANISQRLKKVEEDRVELRRQEAMIKEAERRAKLQYEEMQKREAERKRLEEKHMEDLMHAQRKLDMHLPGVNKFNPITNKGYKVINYDRETQAMTIKYVDDKKRTIYGTTLICKECYANANANKKKKELSPLILLFSNRFVRYTSEVCLTCKSSADVFNARCKRHCTKHSQGSSYYAPIYSSSYSRYAQYSHKPMPSSSSSGDPERHRRDPERFA